MAGGRAHFSKAVVALVISFLRPSPHQVRYCLHCQDPAIARCRQCRHAFFCSEGCQRAAWIAHQPCCGLNHPRARERVTIATMCYCYVGALSLLRPEPGVSEQELVRAQRKFPALQPVPPAPPLGTRRPPPRSSTPARHHPSRHWHPCAPAAAAWRRPRRRRRAARVACCCCPAARG